MSRISMPRGGLFLLIVVIVSAGLLIQNLAFTVGAEAGITINLVVNGAKLEPDVPPQVVNNRTLVPVRIVSETLGADVKWDQALKAVTITRGEDRIILVINKELAWVNGEILELDVAPIIVDNRTMVPIRFVGETLNAQIGWDQDTKTVSVDTRAINSIHWSAEPGGLEVVIGSSAPIAAIDHFTLTDPDRIVIDVNGTRLDLARSEMVVGLSAVTRIRTGTLPEGKGSRIVLDLSEPTGYSVSLTEAGDKILVTTGNKLVSVSADGHDLGPRIQIETSGPIDYSIFELTDPHRVVVNVNNTTLSTTCDTQTIPVWLGSVHQVRVAQFEENTARVVVDLLEPIGYSVVSKDNGLSIQFRSEAAAIAYEDRVAFGRAILQGEGSISYTVEELSGGTELLLRVTGMELEQEYHLPIDDGAVTEIDVRLDPTAPGVVLVTIGLAGDGGYTISKGQNEDGAERLYVDIKKSSISGQIVVLDPGHGGPDPGAVGLAGTFEKDLNLAVALKLRELLRAAGAKVVMTRYSDVGVGLIERPEIANRAGGDLFLSIHHNSHWIRTKSGTETYWSGHAISDPRNAEFAQAVQNELVRALGLSDRGIKREDAFRVCRVPQMPAALAEVGYLSNPVEEALLRLPQTQERVAEALFRAIVSFLNGG